MEAILNFQAMTECKDTQLAARVLAEDDWDVTRAAQSYFSEENA